MIEGVAEIGAEGLLGTAGQVLLFDGGQLEDGLSPSPEVVPEPGVGLGLPGSEIDDGQPPYGDEDPGQSRITHHTPNQGRGSM